ncbi:MAG TPA: thioredoxin domain-containing protein [Methanocorpusculum sp.]|nr:thioredoxin domain-containing protein [Methanocorpusculum sp.]
MTKPVLYDFFTTWCGPCRIQSPIVDGITERLGDKVDVRKIDVDENSDLPMKYGISVVPTIIVEKDGKVIHRWEGVTDAREIEAVLTSIFD